MFNFKRATILAVMTLLLVFQLPVGTAAPTDENQIPTVALLFVNNAKTTYDDELTKKIMDNFSTAFQGKYTVLAGGPYFEMLNKQGVSDLTTAERKDIIEVFKNEDVDYIVYTELQPFNRKEMQTYFTIGINMTAIMPLKIIGVKENKSYYNGKFIESTREDSALGGVGNKFVSMKALDLVIVKLNGVLSERLPLSKPILK